MGLRGNQEEAYMNHAENTMWKPSEEEHGALEHGETWWEHSESVKHSESSKDSKANREKNISTHLLWMVRFN